MKKFLLIITLALIPSPSFAADDLNTITERKRVREQTTTPSPAPSTADGTGKTSIEEYNQDFKSKPSSPTPTSDLGVEKTQDAQNAEDSAEE